MFFGSVCLGKLGDLCFDSNIELNRYTFIQNLQMPLFMKTIFLCFANDEKESLQSLKKEREALLKLLDKGHSKGHFALKEIPNATRDKVVDGLIDYSKSLNVFFFSGHAGRDKLVFEDSNAHAEGIAGLLEQCPNLDLVILNGCSTVGQVRALNELSSKPAIITTSAPVEDFSATKFSTIFFKALVEQKATLKQAFDTAVSGVKTNKRPFVVRRYRELILRDEEKGVWGVFVPEDRKKLKKWRFPQKDIKQKVTPMPNLKVKNKKNKIDRQININNLKGGIN